MLILTDGVQTSVGGDAAAIAQVAVLKEAHNIYTDTLYLKYT